MTVDTGAPRLANATERRIHQLLVEQLGDDGVVIAGKRVTDHLKDHEIDFLVAIEGAGIVCVEVKGGDVWHDGRSWRQIRRGKEYAIDLNEERQARLQEILAEFENKMNSYVTKARAVSKSRPGKASKAAPSYDAKVVRSWAADNGYEVGDRGRIPLDILSAYENRRR